MKSCRCLAVCVRSTVAVHTACSPSWYTCGRTSIPSSRYEWVFWYFPQHPTHIPVFHVMSTENVSLCVALFLTPVVPRLQTRWSTSSVATPSTATRWRCSPPRTMQSATLLMTIALTTGSSSTTTPGAGSLPPLTRRWERSSSYNSSHMIQELSSYRGWSNLASFTGSPPTLRWWWKVLYFSLLSYGGEAREQG